MLDEKKYPKLYESTEATIRQRVHWLKEAIQCQLMCDLLPEEIKAMDIYSSDYSTINNRLNISIRNEVETVKTLKLLGIQGLKPRVRNWSKEVFYTTGTGVLPNGCELSITIDNIDKPNGCQIKEETRVVTDFVLVCEQTGQPL